MTGARRAQRELRTVRAMIGIYCHAHHGTRGNDLCGDCRSLYDYAESRVERCRFLPNKPTCAQCPIHCYKPEMRERIRAVMRCAGPRMLFRHPVLAVAHLVDRWRWKES